MKSNRLIAPCSIVLSYSAVYHHLKCSLVRVRPLIVVVLVTLSLLAATRRADAQIKPWTLVTKSPDKLSEFFVDPSSIGIQGAFRVYWFKALYHVPQGGNGLHGDKWLSSTISRETVNCGTNQVRSDEFNFYYDDGTYETLPNPAAKWESVPRDSTRGQIVQFACSHK